MAQQSRTSMTHSSIDDDDKTMSIKVDGTVNGREISYNRRFDVRGMNGSQKDALKQRVFDSLGVGESPKPPKPPVPPAARRGPNGPVGPQDPEPSRRREHTSEHSDDDANKESVTFVCKTCTGNMKLEILGHNFGFTREAKTNKDRENPFPMTVDMAPGKYEYIYWQNSVQQMHLLFEVKAGEKNEVTVK